MPALTANNAVSRLAGSLTIDQTTLSITAGDGGKFPVIASGSGDWFPMTLQNAAGDIEILRVTARSGDSMTVSRGQEGTSTKTWNVGDRVELRYTNAVHQQTLQKSGNLAGILDLTKARTNLGLGDAATRTVGTSVDNLMAVGAFGLGLTPGTVPIISGDMNAQTRTGFYYAAGTSSNLPVANDGYLTVEASTTSSRAKQTFMVASSDRLFLRRMDNGTWSPWVETVHSGSTSLVVESGSNSSGRFIRFADGTQICLRRVPVSEINPAPSTTTVTGGYAYISTTGRAFPATFATPEMSFAIQHSFFSLSVDQPSNGSTGWGALRWQTMITSSTPTQVGGVVNLYAIGTWK